MSLSTDYKIHSDLIWDSVDSNSGVVLLSCISPAIDHFDTTIVDLRLASRVITLPNVCIQPSLLNILRPILLSSPYVLKPTDTHVRKDKH